MFGISSRTQLRVRVPVGWGLGLDVICESILSKLCVYTLKHMIHILCSCKGIEKCHRMYFIDSFVKCAEKTGDKICKNNSFHFLNVWIEKTTNFKPCLGIYFQFHLSIYVEYQARWHFFLFFNLHFLSGMYDNRWLYTFFLKWRTLIGGYTHFFWRQKRKSLSGVHI